MAQARLSRVWFTRNSVVDSLVYSPGKFMPYLTNSSASWGFWRKLLRVLGESNVNTICEIRHYRFEYPTNNGCPFFLRIGIVTVEDPHEPIFP